jgi:PHD/YefM family antitoxin component YafN of YafNO toxin-antitoxin module
MFRSEQIITATQMIKKFNTLSQELQNNPQAMLITQKSKDPLVLVSAKIYESLLENCCYNTMRRGENPFYLD